MSTVTSLAILGVGLVIGTILAAGLLGVFIATVMKTVHWIFD